LLGGVSVEIDLLSSGSLWCYLASQTILVHCVFKTHWFSVMMKFFSHQIYFNLDSCYSDFYLLKRVSIFNSIFSDQKIKGLSSGSYLSVKLLERLFLSHLNCYVSSLITLVVITFKMQYLVGVCYSKVRCNNFYRMPLIFIFIKILIFFLSKTKYSMG
jgi:hypothetical protein